MKVTYFIDNDTLVIQLSDKPVAREVSQDWNTHISYEANGSVVEIAILEAAKRGMWPPQERHIGDDGTTLVPCT